MNSTVQITVKVMMSDQIARESMLALAVRLQDEGGPSMLSETSPLYLYLATQEILEKYSNLETAMDIIL